MQILLAVAVLNVGTWAFLLASAQILGVTEFGELSVVLGLVNIIGLPLAAVQVTLAREVAEMRATGRADEAARLGGAFLVAAMVAAVLVTAVFGALVVPLATLLGFASLGSFALVGLVIPITVLLPVALGILQGEQRFRDYGVSLALSGGLRPLILGGLAAYGMRLAGAVLAIAAAAAAALVAAGLHLRGAVRRAESPRDVLRGPARALLPVAAGLLAVTALTNTDLLVAKASLTSEDAGIFGASAFIGRVILYLPLTIVAIMFPRVAARRSRGEDTSDILGRSLLVVVVSGAVFTAVMALAPGPILRVGFGDEFSSGADKLVWFGVGATLFAIVSLYVNYELSRGSHGYAYSLLGLAAAQVVVLSFVNGSTQAILAVDILLALAGIVGYELTHRSTARAIASTLFRFRRAHSDEELASLGAALRRASAGLARAGAAAAGRATVPTALTALYGVVGVAATWPVATRLNSSFFGFGNDNLGGIWNFWWWSYAADNGLDPDRSPFLSAPFGFDLTALPLQPYERYLGEWLTSAFGEVAAYNLIILASFPLAGLFAYLLTNYLLRNRVAAAVAGAIYAFAPFHFGMALNYPALSSIQWVPLYFLFVARTLIEKRLRDVFGCIVTFGILAIGSYYYAFQATFITLVIFVVFAVLRRRQVRRGIAALRARAQTPRSLAGITATSLAGLALLAFMIAKPLQVYLDNREGFSRPLSEAVRYSARPWAWVTPGIDHPVFGDRLESFYTAHLHDAPSYEQSLYLGFIPITLAILGVVMLRRSDLRMRIGVVALIGLSGAVIALGPYLPLSTDYYAQWPAEGGSFKLPMPGLLMFELAPTFRFFSRAQVFVILAVAVLAAAGIVWLIRRLSRPMVILLVPLLVAGVGFEYANRPPAPVVDVGTTPPVYQWLRDQPGDFTIAEYPMPPVAAPRSLYYQFWARIHQRPMVNNQIGAVALASYPLVADISNPVAAPELARLGVRYAVVHTVLPPSTTPPYQPVLPDDSLPRGLVAGYPQLRLEVRLPDADVYRVLPAPRPTGRVAGVVNFGEGFFPAEGPSRAPFHWMGTAGELSLWSFGAGRTARFRALLQSYAVPRTVRVLVNDAPVTTLRVGVAPRLTEFTFPVTEGIQTVTLRADPPGRAPAEVDGTPDPRELAIGVRRAQATAGP